MPHPDLPGQLSPGQSNRARSLALLQVHSSVDCAEVFTVDQDLEWILAYQLKLYKLSHIFPNYR